MHVSTTLDENQAEKLTHIQKQANQDTAEILTQALELSSQKIKPLD